MAGGGGGGGGLEEGAAVDSPNEARRSSLCSFSSVVDESSLESSYVEPLDVTGRSVTPSNFRAAGTGGGAVWEGGIEGGGGGGGRIARGESTGKVRLVGTEGVVLISLDDVR